jgi:hypothetical protein
MIALPNSGGEPQCKHGSGHRAIALIALHCASSRAYRGRTRPLSANGGNDRAFFLALEMAKLDQPGNCDWSWTR